MSDAKIQVSGSIGDTYFILKADTAAELVQASADVAASLSEVLDNLTTAKQVVMAKEVFTAKKAAAPAAAAAKPAAAPQAAPPGQTVPTCAHGSMEYKSGVSKAGNNYKMWACPSTDRAEQCKAQFIK